MGHVRDAMRKFESQQPETPPQPQHEQQPREEPSAVIRAMQHSGGTQTEEQGDNRRPSSSTGVGAGVGADDGRACPFSNSQRGDRKTVAAAVAAAVGSGAASAVAESPAAKADARFAETAVVHGERGSMISEQYRIMRTNLMAKFEGGRFCTMITSAEANEGKSVTTVNLALAMAELQEGRTLIVDCDLRKGRLAKLAGVAQTPGVTEILHSRATLRDCLRSTGVSNLDVLPAGQLAPQEVGELLGRPELAELICNLRRQYEFILVDTPPVNMVSDVGMIGRCANEALMVVRMNRTSREAVNKAMRLLRAVNVNVCGLALTHQKYFIPGYLYKYS